MEAALQRLPSSPPVTYSTLPHVSGGSKLRDTGQWGRRNQASRKERRAVGGDSRGVKSVPRGAGDKEAHVIQRPPGAGLGLGPLRALGRGRLGLRRLRSALAAAKLSAHGLQEERPVRCWASRTPPSPCPAPVRPSPQDAGEAALEYPSAGLHAALARAAALRRADVVVTSPRADTALELPERSFWPRGRGPTNSTPPTSNGQTPPQRPEDPPHAQPGETNGMPTAVRVWLRFV